MRVASWGYDMADLGYNWSFSINLEDIEQLKPSRKGDDYPLSRANEFCGSTISKLRIKDFNQKKNL